MLPGAAGCRPCGCLSPSREEDDKIAAMDGSGALMVGSWLADGFDGGDGDFLVGFHNGFLCLESDRLRLIDFDLDDLGDLGLPDLLLS